MEIILNSDFETLEIVNGLITFSFCGVVIDLYLFGMSINQCKKFILTHFDDQLIEQIEEFLPKATLEHIEHFRKITLNHAKLKLNGTF